VVKRPLDDPWSDNRTDIDQRPHRVGDHQTVPGRGHGAVEVGRAMDDHAAQPVAERPGDGDLDFVLPESVQSPQPRRGAMRDDRVGTGGEAGGEHLLHPRSRGPGDAVHLLVAGFPAAAPKPSLDSLGREAGPQRLPVRQQAALSGGYGSESTIGFHGASQPAA